MKTDPGVIELDEEELHAKLDRIEAVLGADIAKPFRQLLGAYITVRGLLRDKKLSIKRLRKIIFGTSTICWIWRRKATSCTTTTLRCACRS